MKLSLPVDAEVSIPYSSGLKFRAPQMRDQLEDTTRARFQSPIHRVSNLEILRIDLGAPMVYVMFQSPIHRVSNLEYEEGLMQ